jgi:transposase-like protein
MLELGVRTTEQLAGELGVSSWSLKRWAKVYGQDSAAEGRPGGGGPSVADAAALTLENARLRRELETISRQRDILKKPWASWVRNRRTLRSDHQDENRTILL